MKHTQAQVNYRRGFAARQCGKCRMYEKEDAAAQYGICTAVTGSITPYGVCDVFAQLTNPFGRTPHGERVARFERTLYHLKNNPY